MRSDAQVRRYTRAATQKIENLTNRDQNIRGNLHTVLTALSAQPACRRSGGLPIQPVFRLYEQTLPVREQPVVPQASEQADKRPPVLDAGDRSGIAAAAAKAAALCASEYGRGAIAAYVGLAR